VCAVLYMLFNFEQTPVARRAIIVSEDRAHTVIERTLSLRIECTLSLRIETPCAVSGQAGYAMGPFRSRQACLNDSNQETIGLVGVAAASDLKQLPHLTRVEGGGSGGSSRNRP
jgi:hypothetical protein